MDTGSGPVQNPALSQADFNTYLAQWQAANGAQFYQNAMTVISSFMDPLAAMIVATGAALGDANALSVVKWIHSIYTYHTTNLATVKGWATPAAMNVNMMSYSTLSTPPVTLLAVATSVLAALNTKYPGQV
jgi:hypothetical protein